jgi:hypothetical protein
MDKDNLVNGEAGHLDLFGRIVFFPDPDTGLFWGTNLGNVCAFLLIPEGAITGSDEEIGRAVRSKARLLVVARVEQIAHIIDHCGLDCTETIASLEEKRDLVAAILAAHPEYQPTFDVIQLEIDVRKAREANRLQSLKERRIIQDDYDHILVALGRQYGFQCLCCGSTTALEIDHIVPLINGGTSDFDNLQLLCETCNNRKGTQTIDYRPLRPSTGEVSHVS